MAVDKRALASEQAVGALHGTLPDVINRLPLMDHQNSGAHRYVSYELTNSASGSTAVGDVLAVSSLTAILGDTVSSLQKYVVAAEIIANAATGRFVAAGPISAKCNGACATMQYLRKSATARSVEDAGVAVGATTAPPVGAVGIALAAASGGFVTMLLFDRPATSAAIIVPKLVETQAVTSSTVLVNDDALLYALAANQIVKVTAKLWIVGNSTGNFKLAFTVPSGTIRWNFVNGIQVNTAATIIEYTTITASGSTQAIRNDTTPKQVTVEVYVTNGATPGNLQLQWAQNTSDGTATKVLLGSRLEVYP